MSKHKSAGHTQRDLLSAHNTQNGKGDADRSPGWRDHYHEIDWLPGVDCGFRKVSPGRFRKTYGDQRAKHPQALPELSEFTKEVNALCEKANLPAPFVQLASPLIAVPKIAEAATPQSSASGKSE